MGINRKVGLGLAGLVTSGAFLYLSAGTGSERSVPAIQISARTQDVHTSEFDQVVQGRMAPQDGIESILKTIPQYAHAIKTGALRGVLYNPSDEQVLQCTKELLPDPLAQIEESIADYQTRKSKQFPFIMVPSSEGVIGPQSSNYLICTPSLFKDQYISGSDDIRFLLVNWISMAQDRHDGVALNGVRITYRTSEEQQVNKKFAEVLLSVRSMHSAIADTCKLNYPVGKKLLAVVASQYLRQQDDLHRSASSAAESLFLHAQLQMHNDFSIIHEGRGPLFIEYNIKGTKGRRQIATGKDAEQTF